MQRRATEGPESYEKVYRSPIMLRWIIYIWHNWHTICETGRKKRYCRGGGGVIEQEVVAAWQGEFGDHNTREINFR